MYVEVTFVGDAPALALREADDFTAFKVVIEGEGGWNELSRALGDAGRVDQSHAWIRPDALRALHADADAAWLGQLDGMVSYAASKQWVDDDGAIRAHCEWPVNRRG